MYTREMMYPEEVVNKFWSRVIRTDGCWYYGTGATGGYSLISWKEVLSVAGAPILAHRLAYWISNGEIPYGLVIDHECHNLDPICPAGKSCLHRRCVNPQHLIARTLGQNVSRAALRKRIVSRHCPSGHEFTEENTFYIGRSRRCKQCNRDNANRHHARTRPSVDHTRCVNGHEYTEENTRISFDKARGRERRRCRACTRTSANKRRALCRR